MSSGYDNAARPRSPVRMRITSSPVRDRIVNECRPQQRESQECFKAHTLNERAGDQRGRDDREHHLVRGEREMRNRRGVIRVRRRFHANQTGKIQRTDKTTDAGSKRERVADENPLHADQTHYDKTEVERREYVLAAHHTAVKNASAGVIIITSAVATKTQPVSPALIVAIVSISLLLNKF